MSEVAAAYARLREVDDPAIAIAVLDEATALAKADAAIAAGLPLAGVPFMVKDNIDVAGLPTTAGCPSFAYLPTHSATAVARLEAAGAVAIAKTNLDQFATGLVGTRSPYGTPINPRDHALIPGGSSSGSAVAVARDIVSFALGTDTAGSGRVPAAMCGIVGMKPTRGWLSTAGVVPAVRSLDCVSVFARSVEDAWRVTVLAAGFDGDDPLSRRAEFGAVPGNPYRVGNLDDVDLEPFLAAGALLYDGPWVAERYAAVGEFIAHATDANDVVASIVLGGAKWTAADLANAQIELARLRRLTDATWEQFDAIVLPTVPRFPTRDEVAADPVGVNTEMGRFTTFANLLDLCAVALPDNRTVLAPAWRDDVAASVAAELNGETWQPESSRRTVQLAVVGAHLYGQPLHGQITELGGTLDSITTTSPDYRLYALANQTPPKPGLVRVDRDGAAIEVEVYVLTEAAFGRFTAAVPSPLAIGSVELVDGRRVRGFVCEPYGLTGATDITQFRGWRAYLAANPR